MKKKFVNLNKARMQEAGTEMADTSTPNSHLRSGTILKSNESQSNDGHKFQNIHPIIQEPVILANPSRPTTATQGNKNWTPQASKAIANTDLKEITRLSIGP